MSARPEVLEKGTPVNLPTAKVQAADWARFEELGVAAVLAKPFDPMTVATQVSAALGWEDGTVAAR